MLMFNSWGVTFVYACLSSAVGGLNAGVFLHDVFSNEISVFTFCNLIVAVVLWLITYYYYKILVEDG